MEPALNPRLVVIAGVPEGDPRVHSLRSARTTVGRAQDRDVQLPASSFVSRLHFTIDREDGDRADASELAAHQSGSRPRFFLTDSSFNGVYVDGSRAPKGERLPLRDGAVLALGTGALRGVEPITLHFHLAAGALGARGANGPLAVDGSPARGGAKASAGGGLAALTARARAAELAPTVSRAARQPEREAAFVSSPCVSTEDSAQRRRFAEQPRPSPRCPRAEPQPQRGGAEADGATLRPAPPSAPPAGLSAECASDGDDERAGTGAARKRARSPALRSEAADEVAEEEERSVFPGFVTRAKRGHNAHAAAVRGANKRESGLGSLAREYGAPPLSLLDARVGFWRERRSYWLDGYGIRSEEGRPPNLLGFGGGMQTGNDTSVFDPTLCELAYRWWVQPGGSVLDPFAGGSVRGVVAARLGLEYHGVELSGAQIRANREQAREIGAACEAARVPWAKPRWLHADARKLQGAELDGQLPPAVDLLFTCPPYYDLEVYTDNRDDLSNAPTFAAFLAGLEAALGGALRRLRTNRFACVVVGDVRDRRTGCLRDLPMHTSLIMHRHGLKSYNSLALVPPFNTAPMRARSGIASGKVTCVHQQVLVFWKGESDATVPYAGIVPNQAISWE